MSDALPRLQAKVLTCSDGVIHGTRDDKSGAALVEHLTTAGFDVVEQRSSGQLCRDELNVVPFWKQVARDSHRRDWAMVAHLRKAIFGQGSDEPDVRFVVGAVVVLPRPLV